MNRVVHFELNVPDAQQAQAFYADVFGWSLQRWGDEEYWLASTGEGEPGIDGAIMPSRDGQPRTVVTVDVASLDKTTALVQERGGKVVVAKTTVPGVGYLAYCTDPGGTIFGVMESDEQA